MSNPVLDILIKATLLLASALMMSLVWRRTAAATRHLIWALALGGVLVLPIAERVGPSWHVLLIVRTPATAPPSNGVAVSIATSAGRAGNAAAPRTTVIAPGVVHSQAALVPDGVSWSLGGILLAAWLVGVALVLGTFAFARVQVAQLARRAAPLVQHNRLSAPLRQAYAAAQEIDSGYDRNRALAALGGSEL